MDEEIKDMLQNMDSTLKRIEIILLRIESKMESESSEEFYKKQGIPRFTY